MAAVVNWQRNLHSHMCPPGISLQRHFHERPDSTGSRGRLDLCSYYRLARSRLARELEISWWSTA